MINSETNERITTVTGSAILESTHGVVSQKVTELTERVGRALSEQKQLNL